MDMLVNISPMSFVSLTVLDLFAMNAVQHSGPRTPFVSSFLHCTESGTEVTEAQDLLFDLDDTARCTYLYLKSDKSSKFN